MQQLLEKIKELHPAYQLIAGETYRWNPNDKIIEFDAEDTSELSTLLLLHELGHAELGHYTFNSDIDLVKKEAEAWSFVQHKSNLYGVSYCEETAEHCLDTYRAWLDRRSSCPECHYTGYQLDDQQYDCINCDTLWIVTNDQIKRVCRRIATTNSALVY